MQDKHLLIVTGPQGSGNHLFARIFSQHPKVHGWQALLDQYWVPSDEEPFAEYWVYPERLSADYFDSAQYFVANVSAPFFYDGQRQLPKIQQVAEQAQSLGIKVTVAIVCRDININRVQQQRVGNAVTIESAHEYYAQLIKKFRCHFISNETFFAWGQHYIEYLGQQFDFPVDADKCRDLIDKNPNEKYVQAVETHWLDDTIRAGRRPFIQRRND